MGRMMLAPIWLILAIVAVVGLIYIINAGTRRK